MYAKLFDRKSSSLSAASKPICGFKCEMPHLLKLSCTSRETGAQEKNWRRVLGDSWKRVFQRKSVAVANIEGSNCGEGYDMGEVEVEGDDEEEEEAGGFAEAFSGICGKRMGDFPALMSLLRSRRSCRWESM